jgi:hypothetical protein
MAPALPQVRPAAGPADAAKSVDFCNATDTIGFITGS